LGSQNGIQSSTVIPFGTGGGPANTGRFFAMMRR
jgi:hypothetical protein